MSDLIPFKPYRVRGTEPVSPIHYSPTAGVHADIGFGGDRVHVPFQGQTTLPTFGIGGSPGAANDQQLLGMGGTLINRDIFNP